MNNNLHSASMKRKHMTQTDNEFAQLKKRFLEPELFELVSQGNIIYTGFENLPTQLPNRLLDPSLFCQRSVNFLERSVNPLGVKAHSH